MNELMKTSDSILWAGPDMWERAKQVASLYAASGLVPKHLSEAAVLIGLDIARRTGQSELAVLQAMYEVQGRPGWSSQYLIARARQLGHPIGWDVEGQGDGLVVTAYFESHPERRATTSMEMARAEGWARNPKYKTMPELMLRYRSATMLTNLYLPEVKLGLQTVDELEVMDVTPEPTPEPDRKTAQQVLDAVLEAEPEEPTPAPAEEDDDDDDVMAPTDELSRRRSLERALGDLKDELTDEEVQRAKDMSGVQRLKRSSPLERWESLYKACQIVLDERSVAPSGGGRELTRANIMQALGGLTVDERKSVCEGIGLTYDGDSGYPTRELTMDQMRAVLDAAQL